MASRPPPLPNDNQHDRCTTKLVMISTEGHCVCCCWCCCCCWSYIDFSFCDSLTAPCCPAAITLPWAVHVPLPFHNCAFAHPSLRHMYIFLFFFFIFWLTTARRQKRAHLRLGLGNLARVWFVESLRLGFGNLARVLFERCYLVLLLLLPLLFATSQEPRKSAESRIRAREKR